METELRGNTITVQGVGSPVPVQNKGGKAGPAGPSASDCGTVLVAAQAETAKMATGIDSNRDWTDICDPFQRRSSLSRSPPVSRRGSVSSVSSVGTGETAGIKRCRTEETDQKTEVEELRDMLGKITVMVRELKTCVTAIPNTKMELKKGISKLGHYVEAANKKCQDCEIKESSRDTPREKRTAVQIRKESSDVAVQVELDKQIQVQTESINKANRESKGTQTNRKKEGSIDTEGETLQQRNYRMANYKKAKQLRKEISNKDDYEGFVKIATINWPIETYEMVIETEGNPLLERSEKDLTLLAKRGEKMDKGMGRQFKVRFPEIEDLQEEEEGCSYLVYEAKTATVSDICKRFVYKVSIEELEENTYTNLLKLREIMTLNGRTRVALPVPDHKEWERLKKLLEYVFSKANIAVMAYLPRLAGGGKPDQENKGNSTAKKSQKNQKEHPTEAIIVAAQGKTYAELLRNMKEGIDINQMGVEIRGLRKTRNGDLLVEVNKGSKGLETLKASIEGKLGVETTIRGGIKKTTTLHLRGMDEITTKEQIEEAVRAASGNQIGELKISSLRPAYGGTQNATVIASSGIAETLISMSRIRIGWVMCRVEQRFQVKRCGRCWEPGHQADECAGVNRRNLCLKCGRDGHRVKDCGVAPHCPICRKEGHRADSTACPVYRKALNRLIRQKKQIQNNASTAEGIETEEKLEQVSGGGSEGSEESNV